MRENKPKSYQVYGPEQTDYRFKNKKKTVVNGKLKNFNSIYQMHNYDQLFIQVYICVLRNIWV